MPHKELVVVYTVAHRNYRSFMKMVPHIYLHNCQYFVEFEGFVCSTLPVKLGLPQGSVLGPLLFLIQTVYINGINDSVVNCDMHLFADDSKLSKQIKKVLIINICRQICMCNVSTTGVKNGTKVTTSLNVPIYSFLFMATTLFIRTILEGDQT